MISKNQIKIIRSLKHKKGRLEAQAFVVEGTKSVLECLEGFMLKALYCTAEWLAQYGDMLPVQYSPIVITSQELTQISFQKTPQEVLAVFQLPEYKFQNQRLKDDQLYLVLDGVQDPGNVGTIVRLADWFGITRIYASMEVADVFSPKCVQSTMGSLARVEVFYTDLETLLSQNKHLPIYGTHLQGENIYDTTLSPHGIIVMGSEGRGITPSIEAHLTHKLLIPHYSMHASKAESLNVAIAAAVVCAEFRRR